MRYDFETLLPAWGTDAPMWQILRAQGASDPDVILFGVAEMRFELAPPIRSALREMAETAAFGYNLAFPAAEEAFCAWSAARHGWTITPEDLRFVYGVVSGIGYVLRAITEPGDGVVVLYPSYGPFPQTVEQSGRRLVRVLLRETDGRWEIDFDALRAAAADPGTKALILCSPHNPVGRVWTRAELEQIVSICLENGLYIISDEIHCDLVYKPHVHIPTASLSPEAAEITVTLTAPSKTFNLAGLSASTMIVTDPALRKRTDAVLSREMGHYLNVAGMTAMTAAYRECGPWLDEVLDVIAGNYARMKRFLAEKIPGAKTYPLEGTYLQWADFACLAPTEPELEEIFKKKAKFFTDNGTHYGPEYGTFRRINLACPQRYLETALARLDAAVNG